MKFSLSGIGHQVFPLKSVFSSWQLIIRLSWTDGSLSHKDKSVISAASCIPCFCSGWGVETSNPCWPMQQSSRPSIRLYCPYYTHTYLESFLSSQYLCVIPFTFKFGNINEITRLKLRNWNQIRPPQFLPIKNSWERRMWWGRPYNLRIFPAYIPWRNATHCHPCIRAELLHLYKKKTNSLAG